MLARPAQCVTRCASGCSARRHELLATGRWSAAFAGATTATTATAAGRERGGREGGRERETGREREGKREA